jgi:hypothetical protein
VETRLKALELDTGSLNAIVKEGGASQTELYNTLSDIHMQLSESTQKHKEIANKEANAFLAVTNAALKRFNNQMTAKHSELIDMLSEYFDDVKRTTSEQQKRLEQLSVGVNAELNLEVCLCNRATIGNNSV